MASPNILSPTTVYARTSGISPATTGEFDFLVNTSGSNAFIRINSLYAANIDGTANVDCTIKWYNAATGGTGFAIANTVTVPADATIVIIGHDAPLYLDDNTRITVQASAGGDLTCVASYEQVS